MKHLLIIILILFAHNLFSQINEDTLIYKCFAINSGINQVKEQNIHTKVHGGIITGLTYIYMNQRKHISIIETSLQYSRPKTNFEPLSASVYIKENIKYCRFSDIYNNSKISCFFGPFAELTYNVCYYPNWDESHLYWSNHLDLGLQNKEIYKISEKKNIIIEADFSVFSLLSRPEINRQYKIDDLSVMGVIKNFHSNIEFGTFNKCVNFQIKADYKFILTSKLSQSIFYQYGYSGIIGNSSALFQNSIHLLGFKIFRL